MSEVGQKKLLFTVFICFFFINLKSSELDDKVESNHKIVRSQIISGLSCLITSITNQTTITMAGQYVLANNLSITNGNGITISANDVTLDLDHCIIDGTGGGSNGVVISAGFSNIICGNGVVRNMSQNGIQVQGSTCTIQDCDFVSNTTGVQMVSTDGNVIENCRAFSCSSAGFYLNGCVNSIVSDCIAKSTGVSGSTYGFISNSGNHNLIQNCIATATTTSALDLNSLAASYAFTGTESQSGIVSCRASVTTTSSAGQTPAYGILYQSTFNGAFTKLTQQTQGNGSMRAAAWSPSGAYLATGGDPVGGGIGSGLTVYTFDGFILTPQNSSFDGGITQSLSWSADNRFLAVGSDPVGSSSGASTVIYHFSDQHQTDGISFLTTSSHTDLVHAVAWHPLGTFLATGDDNGNVRIYSFDYNQLTYLTSFNHGAPVRSVKWSPNGQFLAMAGDTNTVDIRVFVFNGATLTPYATATHGASVYSLGWSADNMRIAIGGASSSSVTTRLYWLNAGLLTLLSSVNNGATVLAAHWSPDSNFVATGGLEGGVSDIVIYSTANNVLTQVSTLSHGAIVRELRWFPTEKFLAVVGDLAGNNSTNIRTYSATLAGVTRCLIQDCTVSSTSGGNGRGVGIYANGYNNIVTGNHSYGNDMNYLFVTNIYNDGLFGSPTLIQNLGVPPF